jgi:hypothetical protein
MERARSALLAKAERKRRDASSGSVGSTRLQTGPTIATGGSFASLGLNARENRGSDQQAHTKLRGAFPRVIESA